VPNSAASDALSPDCAQAPASALPQAQFPGALQPVPKPQAQCPGAVKPIPKPQAQSSDVTQPVAMPRPQSPQPWPLPKPQSQSPETLQSSGSPESSSQGPGHLKSHLQMWPHVRQYTVPEPLRAPPPPPPENQSPCQRVKHKARRAPATPSTHRDPSSITSRPRQSQDTPSSGPAPATSPAAPDQSPALSPAAHLRHDSSQAAPTAAPSGISWSPTTAPATPPAKRQSQAASSNTPVATCPPMSTSSPTSAATHTPQVLQSQPSGNALIRSAGSRGCPASSSATVTSVPTLGPSLDPSTPSASASAPASSHNLTLSPKLIPSPVCRSSPHPEPSPCLSPSPIMRSSTAPATSWSQLASEFPVLPQHQIDSLIQPQSNSQLTQRHIGNLIPSQLSSLRRPRTPLPSCTLEDVRSQQASRSQSILQSRTLRHVQSQGSSQDQQADPVLPDLCIKAGNPAQRQNPDWLVESDRSVRLQADSRSDMWQTPQVPSKWAVQGTK